MANYYLTIHGDCCVKYAAISPNSLMMHNFIAHRHPDDVKG